jgi:hypothetical protein
MIVQPETVIRWYREGFRLYWRWRSGRGRPGRPEVVPEIRDLIRKMSEANALWGAPRIHGELLKLGIEISQAAVSKYMVRHQRTPSQTWRTFLENHAKDIVSIDFFTVPNGPDSDLPGALRLPDSGQLPEASHSLQRDRDAECGPDGAATCRSIPAGYRLAKDCPVPRQVEPPELGLVSAEPMVGGLHHRYFRRAA